ncbi:MAG: hypothetical protein NZ703_05530 [Gemmataceae bacterium]|nr:hypothetical protein [Gemmataceae bacterium]MCS7270526.1 hypothetical protein [Gemmataceae bacterium]MDW8241690.1 hypothetical protein [Thermogemmata sp.]
MIRSGHSISLWLILVGVTCWMAVGCGSPESASSLPKQQTNASADAKSSAKAGRPRPFTRLFVQDLDNCALKWTTVRLDQDNRWLCDPWATVSGFPALDAKRQKLVQMDVVGSLLLVGVRDDADGTFQSGWVLLDTGVRYIDHGDHGHWNFRRSPEVWDQCLDDKQGNPAHLYVYNEKFFLANDRLNGYTRIDPSRYEKTKEGTLRKDTPRFIPGGGNHITLAVVDDKVGYSCWIDGGGPNKGRVDVTPIPHEQASSKPAYSFYLPTGAIHGATTCAGKVFFAPAAGLCWVHADRELKHNPETVKIHHIDLGTEDDKPRRTGAFVTHKNYVLFTTGKSKQAALAILDAQAAQPLPWFVPLPVPAGTQPVTPIIADTAYGPLYAFVFCDRVPPAENVTEVLHVIDLDPNRDGKLDDAKLFKTLTVGGSAVEGHFGHHDLTFDSDRQYGFFTNPADKTLVVLSLKTLEPVATFSFDGKPTALVAVGSRETDD